MKSIVSTLGSSDVTHIFVHDPTALLRNVPCDARTPNYRSYDQRAFLVARPHDVVCVASHKVDPSYAQFLLELGVGPKSENIIELDPGSEDEKSTLFDLLGRCAVSLQKIVDRVSSANRIVLNPYSISNSVYVLAKKLENMSGRSVMVLGGNPDIAASANLKHVAYRKAQEFGIPVAQGEVVKSSHDHPRNMDLLRSAICRHASETGRVIIRGTDGLSGSATVMVGITAESQKQALEVLSRKPLSSVYLVQVLHEICASPNIQVFIEPDHGAVDVLGVSDQRLDDHLKHVGNVAPSCASTLGDMSHFAKELANWLQQAGFTGLVGFDFVEYVDVRSGEFRCFLAEINARTNGAAYPSFLMEHLNARQICRGYPTIGAYLSALVTIRTGCFAELFHDYRSCLFNPRTGRGMIPYTFCRKAMCCHMAFLGQTRKEVEEMYLTFLSQL
jgi:hypothetical protein